MTDDKVSSWDSMHRDPDDPMEFCVECSVFIGDGDPPVPILKMKLGRNGRFALVSKYLSCLRIGGKAAIAKQIEYSR